MDAISKCEVCCPSCKVTFPVETRKCVHCGGRTAPSHVPLPQTASAEIRREDAEVDWAAAGAEAGSHATRMAPYESEDENEEAERGTSPFRVLVTVMWMVLAVAFSLMRACSEG